VLTVPRLRIQETPVVLGDWIGAAKRSIVDFLLVLVANIAQSPGHFQPGSFSVEVLFHLI